MTYDVLENRWCGNSSPHEAHNYTHPYLVKRVRCYGVVTEDPVNHPQHYTKHPSGVECIQVVEHFNFNKGNAIKYIWRSGLKGNEVEDLEKAEWYIRREIERLKNATRDT